jgi:hypothetical protein
LNTRYSHFSTIETGTQAPYAPGRLNLKGQQLQAELAALRLKREEAWSAYDAEIERQQDAGCHDQDAMDRLYFAWFDASDCYDFWAMLIHSGIVS